MKKQIGELKAEKEELKLKLQVQTDLEELDQLKTENDDLSSQIEELNRNVRSFELECRGYKRSLRSIAISKVVSHEQRCCDIRS